MFKIDHSSASVFRHYLFRMTKELSGSVSDTCGAALRGPPTGRKGLNYAELEVDSRHHGM